MTLMIPKFRILNYAWAMLVCLAASLGSRWSFAQDEPWEFSPYRVRVMVLTDDVPELNGKFFGKMADEISILAEQTDKSAWRVMVEEAPLFYRPLIAMGVEQIELGAISEKVVRVKKDGKEREENVDFLTLNGIKLERESTPHEDIVKGDRIAFVHVTKSQTGFNVVTRQLDCQLHLWGPASTKSTRYRSRLAGVVFETIRSTLVPVARIEKIEGNFVRMRQRAAQMVIKVEDGVVVPNLDSPAQVSLSTVYRPVVRKNDKNGKIVIKDGIREIDWTYLVPMENVQAAGSQSYIRAEINGAKRSPLAGRINKSQKKYAVVVRPTTNRTKLTLVTRDKKPKPIPDKKIYLKYPGADRKTKTIEVGQTNRKGEVYIDANDHPLHLIYIKSGERRILARLPIVPGYFEELEAAMQDDKDRLRSEGVLAGFEFSFMDLTVRREVYAMRIRSKLEQKKAKEARELYNLFLELESPDDFQKRLNNENRVLGAAAGDEKQKKLIDGMFSQLQFLVQQRLQPELTSDLDQDILNVEKGGTYKVKSAVDDLEKELNKTE